MVFEWQLDNFIDIKEAIAIYFVKEIEHTNHIGKR